MRTLYHSILDMNGSDKSLDRLSDDLINRLIRKYCTYDRSGHCWEAASISINIDKVGKDKTGWYIDTSSNKCACILNGHCSTSFLRASIAPKDWSDSSKEFIVDLADVCDNGYNMNSKRMVDIKFRWRKHVGGISMFNCSSINSFLGLPKELDRLFLNNCCTIDSNKQPLDLAGCHIKLLELYDCGDVTIKEHGVENIHIFGRASNSVLHAKTTVKCPSSTKVYRWLNDEQRVEICKKLGIQI